MCIYKLCIFVFSVLGWNTFPLLMICGIVIQIICLLVRRKLFNNVIKFLTYWIVLLFVYLITSKICGEFCNNKCPYIETEKYFLAFKQHKHIVAGIAWFKIIENLQHFRIIVTILLILFYMSGGSIFELYLIMLNSQGRLILLVMLLKIIY